MAGIKLKKIIIYFLASLQIVLWPSLALAQVPGLGGAGSFAGLNGSNAALPLFVTNTANPLVDTPILIAIDAASKANQGCATAEQAFAIGDTAAQLGFSGLAVISGGASLTTQLTAKIGKLEGFISCRQAVLTSLEGITTPDLITTQPKQTVSNAATAAIVSLKAKEDALKAQLANATQGVWKALLITVLLNTTKVVANQMVNKIVNNYKIANVKAYTDSLASLMYTNQFVRENYPDSAGQLIARSMLVNPALRNQLNPAVATVANNALAAGGVDPRNLSSTDPNFYSKLALIGSSQANPYFLQTQYAAGASQAQASALAAAQSHIAQGNGYKSPVNNCGSALVQQKNIDAQNKVALDQIKNRQALLDNLLNASEAGQNVSQADINKASTDLKNAQAAWNALPDSLGAADPAVIMCETVSSPAVLVNQGIDALFKTMTNNLSQYNSNNLPGFLSNISNIATQLGSSMILGGITGHSATINGAGAALSSTAAAAGLQTLNANIAANLAKGVDFEVQPNADVANGYSLTWQIVGTALSSASYVTISGPGLTASSTKTSGTTGAFAVVAPAAGATYTLNVYSGPAATPPNALLAQATVTVPAAGSSSSPSSFTGPCPSGQTQTATGCVNSSNPSGSGTFPASAVCSTGNFANLGECLVVSGNDASYCQSACGPVTPAVNGAFTSRAALNIRGSSSFEPLHIR
jgi:hypothetical protein